MPEQTKNETFGRQTGTGQTSAAGTQRSTGRNETGLDGRGLLKQVKSSASDAYQTATTAASEKFDEQKSNLSSGLSSVATSVRNLGDDLTGSETGDKVSKLTSDFSSVAADKLERAADYFESRDLTAMYHDVEKIARKNTALFLGGAFALGFLAARFLKSSPPKQLSLAAGNTFNDLQQRQSSGVSATPAL